MSIPPVNYSVPPPNLNVPPPVAPPLRPTEVPPPPMYTHPPPFTVPLVPGTEPPYMTVPTLQQLNVPPPATAYSSPPVDIHTVPPPFVPPSVAPEFSYRDSGYFPTEDSNFTMSFVSPKIEVKSERDSPCPSDRSYYSQKDGEPSTSKDYEKKNSYVKEEKYNRPSSQLKTRMSPPRDYDRGRHDREYSKGRHDKDDERRRYEKEKERIEREKYYDRERSYDRERRERHYRESKTREHRSRSPSYRHRSRSPSRHSYRDIERERERERYYREKYYREKYKERRELERRRYEYEHQRSLSRDHRSHSRSHYDIKSERVFRSPSRRSPSRTPYSKEREYSRSRSSIQDPLPRKKLTDREKILEEYRLVLVFCVLIIYIGN